MLALIDEELKKAPHDAGGGPTGAQETAAVFSRLVTICGHLDSNGAIYHFSEICPRSRESWGPWWKYDLHVHGTTGWTRDYYGETRISYEVTVKDSATTKDFLELVKGLPNQKDGWVEDGKKCVIGLS
jgi:hypothetical protein